MCVILSTGGCVWFGACVVARGYGCWGDRCGCWGMHGCWGCMVAGGRHVWLQGEHAWLLGGVHGCGGACMAVGGGMCGCQWDEWLWEHAWLQGACVVAGGACMVAGGHVWLGRGHVWLRGHSWLLGGHVRLWGACMVVGACVVVGAVRGCQGGCVGYDEIRSMNGRYASYWNAFLLQIIVVGTRVSEVTRIRTIARGACVRTGSPETPVPTLRHLPVSLQLIM